MCGSMVDIQSPTAEIRRGKKEERKIEITGKSIMVCDQKRVMKIDGWQSASLNAATFGGGGRNNRASF